MGKMPTNALGKYYELKLHCFCLFDAYSMPKNMCSVVGSIMGSLMGPLMGLLAF